jgi:phosphatidylserine/phosphatidylglycerophosphate/cardiolipin synthase-like enzyme
VGADISVRVAATARTGGALLGKLTRIFVETVHTFYAARAAREGNRGAQTGAVTVVQRRPRTNAARQSHPDAPWNAVQGALGDGANGGQPLWERGLGAIHPHVHAKVMSVDRRVCSVGSANLERRRP